MTKPAVNTNGSEGTNDNPNGCKDCGWVHLMPYEFQVSGHHRVMLFDATTICKPVMAKEFAFYTSSPKELQKFIPEYRGIAHAFAETDDDDNIHFFASKLLSDEYNSDGHIEQEAACSECIKKKIFRRREKINGIKEKCYWKNMPIKGRTFDEDVYQRNPWVMRVQNMSFEKNMYKSMDSKFVLLENIGFNFRRPCVLDLKMGTRQHGDDATDRKRKDHEERCEHSTSKSLGMRFCGMQVYHPDTSCYTYLDKYTGRTLDVTGFENTVFAYLADGNRSDIIEPLVNRLEELYQTIDSLDSWRFFCCSLLIMYEGDIGNGMHHNFEVRMIDFSHVTMGGENNEHVGPDTGYLVGLRNLIRLFNKFRDEHKA